MARLLDPDEMPPWMAGLFAAAGSQHSIFAGVNADDCAIISWKGRYLVMTLDFLNAHPIASELGIGSMRDIGRLLVASSLSDLCGSGALPVALLVGLTLPHQTKLREFKTLLKGVKLEAHRHAIPVVGGDTKLGKCQALMAVAIGSADSSKNLFLKNGAQPGDIIWVSGELGATAAAAWGYRQPTVTRRWKSWAKRTILFPRLPLDLSRKVSTANLGRGGTDVSDGLGADLKAVCEASHVGAIIEAEKIPTAHEVKMAAAIVGVPPWSFAFASGGDFQFIVTTSQTARRKMENFGFVEVGEVTKRLRLGLRLSDERVISLPTKGHRDRCNLTFAQEIDLIIRTLTIKAAQEASYA